MFKANEIWHVVNWQMIIWHICIHYITSNFTEHAHCRAHWDVVKDMICWQWNMLSCHVINWHVVIYHVLHFSASLLKSQKTPSFRTQNIRRSVRPKTLTKPYMCNHKVHTHVTNLHIFTPIHMHWMAPYQYAFQECFVGSTQNSPSLPWAKI